MAKTKKPTTSSGSTDSPAGDTFSDPKRLAAVITKDRISRGLTWPAYADWMGLRMSTLYKIAKGRTNKPNELTVDKILKKLAEPTRVEGGAGGEVVSSGQRHPERSED